MLCLLNAKELRQTNGVQSIHHYSLKPLTDYGDLLKGNMFDPAEKAKASAELALKLEPEFGDDDDVAGVLEDGPVEMPSILDDDFDPVDVEEALGQIIT